MKVLGIESSADETSAAIVEDGHKLLCNVVASSMDIHVAYGGVVPEIAARSHIESIIPVIDRALNDVFRGSKREKRNSRSEFRVPSPDLWSQIDAIAVTVGPGLSGSLLIGVLTARTLAIAKNKPLYAVNHVEAHVYANFITQTAYNGERITYNGIRQNAAGRNTLYESRNTKVADTQLQTYVLPVKPPEFPLLALIVSGGHTQLVLFKDHFDYQLLGQTSDDAVGEAYDKVAKILGLSYPGGPSIDKAAQNGNPDFLKLPKARMQSAYEFSFSGLKTAVLRAAQQIVGKDFTFPSFEIAGLLNAQQVADIAASFQKTAIETLVDATETAVAEFNPKSIVIAGGVAANAELRRQLAQRISPDIPYPDIKLCTDNAAMIAAMGCFMAERGQPTADPYTLVIFPNLSM